MGWLALVLALLVLGLWLLFILTNVFYDEPDGEDVDEL